MKTFFLAILVSFISFTISAQCTALFTWNDTDITIQFMDESTSDPSDPIVSWSWDFDDNGNTSNLQNPTYTFSEPQKYDVSLTITTQNGCSSSITIEIETCVLAVNYTVGACDANGNIPVMLTISDIYDNADEIDVILDGSSVPGSPFMIDQENPVSLTVDVAGDGLLHTIQIQSLDIATCGRTLDITVPDCNSNCFLSSLQVAYPTGVTHTVDVGDDFFSPVSTGIILGDVVNFNWIGDGHSTTSDATTGPDSWNSGVISIGSSFNVNIQNPGMHPYYCTPHGGTGGAGMSGEILANCPTGTNLDLEVSFNTSIANAQGFNVYYDASLVAGSPFSYSGQGPQQITISVAGDGNPHPLLIEDVNDPTCTLSMTYDAPDCGQGGGNPVCNLSINLGASGGCDASQNVTLTANVAVANGGSGFNLTIDNGTSTYYPYNGPNTSIDISLPGDGQSHVIEVMDDVDSACTANASITTPNCNLPCSITNLTATAGGGGGGAGIVHTVDVEDFVFNPSIVNITVGDQVEWVWTGNVAHTATSDATSGPDSFDSGLLNNGATYLSPILSEGAHMYYCTPHGSPGGNGMAGTIFVLPPCNAQGEVMVNVSFDVTSNGTNGYEVLVDGTQAGVFSYVGGSAQSANVHVPGDGMSHMIEVKDLDEPTCTASTNIVTADCNGGGNPTCMIDVTASVSGGCDANNEVAVDLTVTASDQGSNFSVLVDGASQGIFAYTGSITNVSINVAGDGQNHTIVVTDDVDSACTASTTVTTPDCTVPCSISNLTAVAGGGGGGAGIVHIVNVEDFVFNPSIVNITAGDQVEWVWTGNVAHTATSDATSGPDSFDSGLLNNGATYLSPILSEGAHMYYCTPHGSPGGNGMAGTIFVLPPCNAQGEVMVNVSFDVTSNGTNGYEVLVDGTQAGVFSYVGGSAQSANVHVPGDGMSHMIEVKDLDEPTCTASTNIVTADCNGGGNPTCMIDVTASVSGGCDANNEVAVDLTVTASDQGSNFSVLVDGASQGIFAYTGSITNVSINVAGDGQNHMIVVTDDVDSACTASTTVTTPDCLSGCNISQIDLSFGVNTTHIVQVQDFEFIPDSLEILIGDTVLFDWVGNIPHTATSDAATGPNSFDSGLLGLGSIFEFVPSATGDLPYYCIPHGAPGGIGMAGNIAVSAACLAGNAVLNISVESEGSSGQGFNLSLDGDMLPESPLDFNPSGISNGTILVPGDSMQHLLVVSDVDNPLCLDSISFISPLCSSNFCEISVSSVEFDNCEGATVGINIDFTSSQGQEGYNIYIDGNLLSANPVFTDDQGNGNLSGIVSGTGDDIEVVVNYILDPSCSDTLVVTTPDCEVPCLISEAVVAAGKSIHIVEVRDFDFFPKDIEVFLGDTVRFIWTGLIPHTTTSDATSGIDVWDSGLFGQGYIYDVVIQELGTHLYYCKPHGGPNGIGMAGSIVANERCDNGDWSTNYSFNVSAGSPLGYNIFVDGILWNSTPIPYMDAVGFNEGVVSIPGDGMNHLVTFQDEQTDFCAFTTNAVSEVCEIPCTIDALVAKIGTDIIHEIEVRDFDFFPSETTVRVGETVRFRWTGDVPHTSNSDAISGVDSWESGLLSKGDTFDIVLSTIGEHPYYCVPHGGPGGIGQSGLIYALPACQEDEQIVHLSFIANGGSPDGFNVFLDGMPFAELLPYEETDGENNIYIQFPADGLEHTITIQDVDDLVCAASTNYISEDCSSECEIAGLNYELIKQKYIVEVRDFDYLPLNITVEVGDTILFEWVGDVPHTVTSDAVDGSSSFSSGLLQKGEQWILILEEIGQHPYYCVPHGGPGGIGMAGSITVVDPCDDEEVYAAFSYTTNRLSGAYDVVLNGNEILSDVSYSGNPLNAFTLALPADNSNITVEVIDNVASDCSTKLDILGINCNDPCFATSANYTYDIDFSMLEVQFSDNSAGNIVSRMWDFGDGNTSSDTNPSHTFDEPLVYEVCLGVVDDQGCEDTFCDKVRFSDEVCIAGFEFIQNDLDFTFINTSDYEDPNTEVLWTFGDGLTSGEVDTAMHTFNLGIYTVCVEITSDSCVATYCQEIDLSDPCLLVSPDFEINYDGTSMLVEFIDQTSGSPDSWLWGFGDGITSTEQNPSHTYGTFGEYNVCLFVQESENSCSKSICRKIVVGTTDLKEVERYKAVKVYPNPSRNGSRVIMSGFVPSDLGQLAEVTILTTQGQKLYEFSDIIREDMPIDISTGSGVFIVKITTERNKYSVLLVKQ